MMPVRSVAVLGALAALFACAQADNTPASSGSASMTIGQVDDGDDDSAEPTTTLPTTGISASATNADDDAETSDVTDTQASGSDTGSSDGDSTTGDSSSTTGTGTEDTSGGRTTDTGSTTTDDSTSTEGVTTDDSTTGGCDHPQGVYGDCLNSGFSACMFNQPGWCLHDAADPPTVGVCSLFDCVDVCDCPAAPATGNAQVVCGFLQGLPSNACFLACGQATTCPDGMFCHNNSFCAFN
jgi:hypothetical protein